MRDEIDEINVKLKALAAASLENSRNQDTIRLATSEHAAALFVIRGILSEMLRQHPTDLSFLRQELKELPAAIGAVAVTILDTIMADADR